MGKADGKGQQSYNPAAEASKRRSKAGKAEQFQGRGGVKKQSAYRQRAKEGGVEGAGIAGVITGISTVVFVVALVLYIVTQFTRKD